MRPIVQNLSAHGSRWTRAGRRIGVAISVLGASVAVAVGAVVLTLRMHSGPSAAWTEFSIGPAAGTSVSIQPSMIRGTGITLKGAVAYAYDIPAVRVIAPEWLSQTRYSINAVVEPDQAASLRSFLQEELRNRLRLETHIELRPFDVLVLSAADAPRLERSDSRSLRAWIRDSDAQLENASMADLAFTLQNVVGKPVIDETAIGGSFNLQFGWTENRLASVTAQLHERFGLQLTPAKRDLEALIVDRIRRDAALVLLEQIGSATSVAPPRLRQRVAQILTIR